MYPKRLRAVLQAILIVGSTIAINSCGDDNKNQVGPPATITLSPTAFSLELGRSTALTVEVKDAAGNINRSAAVTFQSSDAARATVSNNGAVCAGVWDSLTNPVVCTPGTEGPVNITATAGGVTSSPTVVNVHRRISRIEVTPVSPACVSQGQTQPFSFQAFDSTGAPVPASVPLAPIWTSGDTTVGTINSSGVVTARRPGRSTVTASIGTVNSTPANFSTCSPANIAIATQNTTPPETAFTLAPAATKQLAAAVTDTIGGNVSDPGLTYVSNDPSIATVSGTGLVTAVGPGSTAVIAVCLPPTCNGGLAQTVYSNVVSVTVTGASTSRVYVTGPSATTIVPIDTSTNVAGTAITVPTVSVSGTATLPVVNSMIFSKDGNRVFIGTDLVLLTLDVATNTFVNTNSPVRGKVLAVSNAGRLVISDSPNVSIYDSTNNTVITTLSNIPAPTAAAWSPDGSKAYILTGTTLEVYSSLDLRRTVAIAGTANDVRFSPQGSVGYVANAASAIDVRATCDNTNILNAGAGNPLLLAAQFDGARLFAVDTSTIQDISVTVPSAACPPASTSVPHALTRQVDFGVGTFTPRRLIVTSSGARVFVTSNLPNVLTYDPATGVASAINLIGGATAATTGGATLDGAQVYIGAQGTNDVQRIDVATGVAVQPITVGLRKSDNTSVSPEFVAVRPR